MSPRSRNKRSPQASAGPKRQRGASSAHKASKLDARQRRRDYLQQGQNYLASHLADPRFLMLMTTLALVVIGLLMVFSASSITSIEKNGSAFTVVIKQLPYAILGMLLAVSIVGFVPYKKWESTAGYIFIALCFLGLIATAFAGTSALGAKRWLVLGPVSLQPSEFAKIAFVLIAAKIFCRYRDGRLQFNEFVYAAVLAVFLPLGFLYATQSDLGTTAIICVGLLAVLWLGDVNVVLITRALATLVVFGVLSIALTSYRSDRLSFLDPWSDAGNTGYQLIHSFYAFSEGGLFGVGLGNSHEKFQYLPEAQTDFVFSILGEEGGLLMTTLVVVLFLLFLYAGLRIAHEARDPFGTMVAGSLTTMIVFQAFLNIMCVIGLIPTTGKPLPFLSAGGSSMLSSLMMVGIILSVAQDPVQSRRVHEKRRDDLRIVTTKEQGTARQSRQRRPYSEPPVSTPSFRSAFDAHEEAHQVRPGSQPQRHGYARSNLNSRHTTRS